MDGFLKGIKKEISELIALKTEGGYWDFKEMWNDNETSLLHDIICMANNLENRDAYIVIGVRDSKDPKGFAILGVDVTDENRKDQEKLIGFLRDKKFVGGIRPTVYLLTISYSENILLDVIFIKNTTNTPYYLAEPFQGVFKSNIYTRIGDTNTPKNTSADIDKVEYLWKKRFGIDLTPLEKIKYLLSKPQDWFPVGTDGKHSNNKYLNQWHHKQYPEFTITYKIDEGLFNKGKIDKLETDIYWMNRLCHPLHNAYIYEVEVKYFSTVLYSGPAIFADGYRFNRMLWETKIVYLDEKNHLRYCFVEKDSLSFMLDYWLFNHHETVEQTLDSNIVNPLHPWEKQPEYVGKFNPYTVVPVFENHEEHIDYLEYIKLNVESIIHNLGLCKNHLCDSPEYIEYLCNVGELLVGWLEDWRKSRS